MIKKIQVVNNQCSFHLDKIDIDLANAIRRALISDVENYAPNTVTFELNSSCQTDEYIAHRIGLIPFKDPKFNDDVDIDEQIMTFDVTETEFYAHHLQGPFVAACDIPIIKLIEGQSLKGSIKFLKGCGMQHSRFCPVAGVGYEICEDYIKFTFESINDENPLNYLEDALRKLQSRLGNIKYQVELMK